MLVKACEKCYTMFSKRLRLGDIIDFVGGESKRCFVEGEAVIDANHLILCGVRQRTEESIRIEALCIQSSNVSSTPHEIIVKIENKGGKNTRISGSCSCISGESGRCKHVTAVLIYLNRNSFDNLEVLSSTDIKQQWGKYAKQYSSQLYEVVPIKDFCHVKKYQPVNHDLSNELKQKIRNCLLSSAPFSELNKHMKGRSSVRVTEDAFSDLVTRSLIISIITAPNNRINLQNVQLKDLEDDDLKFYNENIALDDDFSIQICEQTINQSGNLWTTERRKRITGSTCYNLYTYSKNKNPNWEKKLEYVLYGKTFCSKATKHGIVNESKAIKAYENITGHNVEKLGLVILPQIPWAGFSPDGIVNKTLLIEIKCPIIGASKSAQEVAKEVVYIDSSNDTIKLKRKHPYYGQIQWGMTILNLNFCDFVVYSSFDKSCLIMKVPYDAEFVMNMMASLTTVYFTEILPFVYRKENLLK